MDPGLLSIIRLATVLSPLCLSGVSIVLHEAVKTVDHYYFAL